MFNKTKGLLKIQGCYTDQQQQKNSDSNLLKNTIKWIKINDIKCFHTQKQFSLKVLPTKAVEDCQVIALRDTQLTMRCKKQKKTLPSTLNVLGHICTALLLCKSKLHRPDFADIFTIPPKSPLTSPLLRSWLCQASSLRCLEQLLFQEPCWTQPGLPLYWTLLLVLALLGSELHAIIHLKKTPG